MSQDIIDHYSRDDYEDTRLRQGKGRLEYLRTKEIIGRYLPGGNPIVVDIGGAAGPYAFWLAEKGCEVHLRDLTPCLIEMAQEKNRTATYPLASIEVSDARALSLPDNWADFILLMGPLYHLAERRDRIAALQESSRILKQDGRIFCAAISRFASLFDGFCSQLYDDPVFAGIVDQDLENGQHRNIEGKEYFTTAYFHEPQEFRAEIEAAGLECEKLIGVEGPIGLMREVEEWMDNGDPTLDIALKYMSQIEEEESLLGASFHFLAVARRKSRPIR